MPALPIIGAVAAVVGAGAAVVGTINSQRNQQKSLKLQQEAAKFERQKSNLVSMRQKIDAIRSARQSYAMAQQAAENQGVGNSSAAQGGQGSIISQMNSNLSFLDQYGFLSDQASGALQGAANAKGRADMWGAVAGLGAQLYGASGGIRSVGAAFKGPAPPTSSGLSQSWFDGLNINKEG